MKKLVSLFLVVALFSNLACVTACTCDPSPDYASLMTEAMANGDYNQAKAYDELRSQKKSQLGINDDFTYDNLWLLSKIVYAEAGSSWLTEEHRQLVASVVINRVNSPEFPNSIYDVINQPGQYAPVGSGYFYNIIPSSACVFSASKILAYGSIAPADVVFQANFPQGSGTYKTIYDNYLGATYFCYANNRHLY